MSTNDLSEKSAAVRPGIRWWPAVGIVAIASAVAVYIWLFRDVHRQTKNLQTGLLVVVTNGLLLLWVLAFSRLPALRRLLIFACALAVIGLAAALLEIRGVTGDLVPVVGFRWKAAPVLPDAAARGDLNGLLELAASQAFPQFCGPDRNGVLAGPKLEIDWQTHPPEELWRQPIGKGWSGFAVTGNNAVTMEQRGDEELTTCYDLATGRLIWKHAAEAHYQSGLAGDGPRTVPTIDGDHVFALGATGILSCRELAGGELVWSKNIVEENESSIPSWGVSGSPLVIEGLVIVSAGGKEGRSLVAYDRDSGERVWSGGDDRAHYSSPVVATIAGVRQILIFNSSGVSSHDFSDGRVLWSFPWDRNGPHIAMPVVLPDGRVLVSSGYGSGSELVQVARDADGEWTTTSIWKSKQLKSKFANIIVKGDSIYGLDDGIMTCLDLATGRRQWKKGRYGHGQLLLVDQVLLVMSEHGDVVLVEPTPAERRELTLFQAFSGKTWNPPALAGPYLLLRTDGEAACFRLPTTPIAAGAGPAS